MELFQKKKMRRKRFLIHIITYYNIQFSSGSYSYNNINEYIKDILTLNGHLPDAIKIEFDLSKFKCELSLKSSFVLDLNKSTFGNLIGFDERLYGYTNKFENSPHWETKTPSITNSINTIHYDLIINSLVDGKYGDVIYTFSTANLERLYPFTIEPIRVGFCEINEYTISSISIYITDVYGIIIDLMMLMCLSVLYSKIN